MSFNKDLITNLVVKIFSLYKIVKIKKRICTKKHVVKKKSYKIPGHLKNLHSFLTRSNYYQTEETFTKLIGQSSSWVAHAFILTFNAK